jgi:hypothetical protein
MATSYDDAVTELYQAPHGDFVNERKRLAGELKTAGDKAGSTKLGKLVRPPISAWTVNQLWRSAREDFDALFETAEKLRKGDLAATGEHRDAIAKLRQQAAKVLVEAGNAASEGTLRRVTTTLSALAATGSFDPDPPGALSADRDPPGFEAIGLAPVEALQRAAKAGPTPPKVDEAAKKREKKKAEIRNAEQALGGARSEVERKQKDVDRLKSALEAAVAAVAKSQETVDEFEAKLAELVRESEE